MTYQIYREQQLHCDLETAWDFFSSPKNLSRITPKEMGFTILTDLKNEPIFEGMFIDYKITPIFSIPMKWCTEIKQVDEHKSFTDFQLKGPYKLWRHFHEFIPNKDGVLMRDILKYKLPFGILGTVAHTLFIRKKINHIFDYRNQVLEQLFNEKTQLA